MSNRKAPPRPADFAFWTEEKLRLADTDMNGHINNVAIGVFCEAGRVELMHAASGPMAGTPLTMVVARVAIDYRREVHYPGRVLIGSAVMALGTSSITVAQALFKDEDCFATSEAVLVILDRTTRRPVSIPEDVRARFLAIAPAVPVP